MQKFKNITLTLIIGTLFFCAYGQSGIGTKAPVASAILELNSTNKGFKGPGIALQSRLDQSLTPERGLIVYNTATAGVSPDNVYGNRYYFWNGSEWVSLPGLTAVEELITPRVFYAKSVVTQTFAFTNDTQVLPLSFETVDLNTANIITPNLAGTAFRINKTGLYELSSFMSYNPNGSNDRALQNLIIQKGTSATGPWVAVAGSRGNWGQGSVSDFKTVIIPIMAVRLNDGEFIRVITACPYPTGGSAQGLGTISITTNTPVAKSLNVRLIDFTL
ncbi:MULTISPECIES: hypothetical protein [unclassified Pedobacter]|uniref:hypothetical protein n=1 Tax=unclassified Pedobacter TaxID=2628915 RepID=UPI001E49CCD4|nr:MULTISPECIES: hypothetical protein [unclassified Pedobacter]